MRADRLVAALLLMQARGRVTAAELADELEVSVATARRDLEALSAAGIPVYPQPGRGGGWSLVGGARTDLSGLSADRGAGAVPARRPGRGRLAARPRRRCASWCGRCRGTFRADAEAAADATMIDPTRWGERDRRRPELVDLLQAAVVRRRKVRLAYANARPRADASGWSTRGAWSTRTTSGTCVAGTEKRAADVPRRPDRRGRADRPARRAPGRLRRSPTRGNRSSARWSSAVRAPGRPCSSTHRFVPVLRDQFGRHCHDRRRPATTGAPGSASPRRRRWTSPATSPAGARWSRWSNPTPSRPSWPGSAPSWSGATRTR